MAYGYISISGGKLVLINLAFFTIYNLVEGVDFPVGLCENRLVSSMQIYRKHGENYERN